MTARARHPARLRACTTLALAIIALSSSGCSYTTANTVTIHALATRYPVSASSQYVDRSGAVVRPEAFRLIHTFAFEREVDVPRHEEGEVNLRLEPELDRIVRQYGGDAVVGLKLHVVEYDTGSHGTAAALELLGWNFGIAAAGAGSVGALAAAGGDQQNFATGAAIGGGFAGLSALSFLIASASNEPSKWRLWVSGYVVKTAPATPPLPARPHARASADRVAAD